MTKLQKWILNRIKEDVNSPDVDDRLQAVHDLIKANDSEYVPLIVKFLQDENSEVRNSALIALSELKDRRAIEHVIPMLEDQDQENRMTAFYCLTTMPDGRSIVPLMENFRENMYLKEEFLMFLRLVEDQDLLDAVSDIIRAGTDSEAAKTVYVLLTGRGTYKN